MPNTECEFSVSLETKILVFLGLIKDIMVRKRI